MGEENKLQEGINDLISMELPVKVDPPPSDPPPTPPVEPPPPVPPVDPPAEPPKVTPPVEPSVEPPPTPPTEPPPAAVPPVPPVPPTPPPDPRDTKITELEGIVASLRTLVESAVGTVAKPTPTPTPADPPPSAVHKFVEKEEDLDKILNSVDNFNEFLSGVVKKVQEETTAAIIPNIIGVADSTVARRMAVSEFFNANQDLIPYRSYVGVVANEIAAANPEWGLDKVIEGLGTEVRKKLAIVQAQPGEVPPIVPPSGTPPVEDPNDPAFVGGTGARKGAPGTKTKMQQGIDDLIDGL